MLSEDPSFYVQNACVTDPTLAPRGMSTLYVLVPVTHQHPNVDWTQERGRFRNLVLRQLRHVGLSDVEKRIRFERVLTPADWEGEHHIYRGATFSLAHNLGQMLHLAAESVRGPGERLSPLVVALTWEAVLPR